MLAEHKVITLSNICGTVLETNMERRKPLICMIRTTGKHSVISLLCGYENMFNLTAEVECSGLENGFWSENWLLMLIIPFAIYVTWLSILWPEKLGQNIYLTNLFCGRLSELTHIKELAVHNWKLIIRVVAVVGTEMERK